MYSAQPELSVAVGFPQSGVKVARPVLPVPTEMVISLVLDHGALQDLLLAGRHGVGGEPSPVSAMVASGFSQSVGAVTVTWRVSPARAPLTHDASARTTSVTVSAEPIWVAPEKE